MPDPIDMRGRPEAVAAIVNAALVVSMPLAIVLLEFARLDATASVALLGQSAMRLLPIAALTAWRTWVHAKRWRAVGGATELRDGTVALVLDLPRLLESLD